MLSLLNKLEETKKVVLDHIRRNKFTTFAELEQVLEDECLVEKNDEGMCYILYPKFVNIILWSTENRLVAEAVSELIDEDKVVAGWCPEVEYVMDEVLILPRARKLRNYDTPHLLPVVLSVNTQKVPPLIRTEKMLTIDEMSCTCSDPHLEDLV